MYILKSTVQPKPFAIVKNPWKDRVVIAIQEEFGLTNLRVDGITFPEIEDTFDIAYSGLNEDGDTEHGHVELTNLVDY